MAKASKKEKIMKKIFARPLCIILMLAMLVPMMSVMASAAEADLVNLYDASKAVCGTPNTGARDNEPAWNGNYYCTDVIYVKEGDVITVGPVFNAQGYYFTTFNADGSLNTGKIKYADCTEIEVIQGNLVIVKWTVPAGTDSFRMATSQMFVDSTLITKNQEFGKADYLAYMAKNKIDLPFFNGENAKDLVNKFPTSDATFAGRGSNKGDVADEKYMTCDYIPVVEGDVIYFGAAAVGQNYQLVLYDADKKPTTHVNKNYMVFVEALDDTHAIYAYRMRPGTAYVRFVAPTDVYNNGQQLVTINQPFTAEGYNNFFNPPETTEPAPADPVPTGDSALVFAAIAIISLVGVAVVAKRRED